MTVTIGRRELLAALGGAAAAWSLAARAQQGGKIPRVGYLWHAGNPQEEVPYFEALLEGFARLGYVDGRNIKLEHRFPNETPERFKSMAAELVSLNVDVLMGGAVASPYLRDETTKVPIVFMFVPDPVGMKLVQSIARPGGNITGLSNFGRDVAGKRLQMCLAFHVLHFSLIQITRPRRSLLKSCELPQTNSDWSFRHSTHAPSRKSSRRSTPW